MKYKLIIPSIVAALAISMAVPSSLVLATNPPPTSTAVPRSKWVTQPIKFSALKTYTHDPAWFEIGVPTNWTADDTSKDDEAIVTFTDPTKNGAVFVDVFANTDELTKSDMADKLDTFVNTFFGKLTKFKASDASQMKNLNGASQYFAYSTKLTNGKTVNMRGDAYYEQYDSTLISIIVLLLPDEQYQATQKQAYTIVDSFKAHPENYEPVVAADPTPEPTTGEFALGNLKDFEHDSGVYSLRVPEDWKESDNSSSDFVQTIWQDSSGTGLVIASAAAATKTYKTADLQAESVSYIKSFTKNTERFKDVKIGKKSVKGTTTLVAFSYTYILNDVEVPIVGVVAAQQSKKTIGFLQLAVPEANADSVSDASEEIVTSFKVNGDASF